MGQPGATALEENNVVNTQTHLKATERTEENVEFHLKNDFYIA